MPIRYFMMWAIGLMTAGPASAPAGNLIPGPLPIGLYASLTRGASSVDEIAAINGNLTSAYWGTPSPGFSNVHDYLDAAQAEGVRVVVEIDPVRIANADVVGITEIVATFDSHPAVVGWYTADEPFWVQPVIPEPAKVDTFPDQRCRGSWVHRTHASFCRFERSRGCDSLDASRDRRGLRQ